MNAKKGSGQVSSLSGNLPSVISLFAGCGGLDLGFHLEGYKSVWSNEFNSWAADTYELNFRWAKLDRRSILDIDPYEEKQIPPAEIIIGGFPCQDFSIIWKRPGLDGSRGSLYKEYLRFIDAKKPKAFVAENVKGILSANGGLAIKQIIKDFESIAPGYCLNIKLYNFADYRVPQFRERVLIVGVRNDTGFDFQHPKPTHGPKAGKPYFTAGMALKNVETVLHNNDHMKIMPRTREILEKIPEGGNFADIPKNDPHYVKGMISHVYRRIHREEPAKTLIAAGGGGTWGY
ncbi:MAG TPA: DNA (cytosine-5-)-methyltransferase, partial [Parachlamydiales bacterium]|nr:DNA (cytosine-5-)-methyltransferase [Parachlamydiales bacterium]